jgi:hypothetical protein
MSPFGSRVESPADAEAASWIQARLGAFGTVGGLVPSGYEAYVAVDHTTFGDRNAWSSSSELLAELGRILVTHTTTPDDAWYAVWEGYGWTSAVTLTAGTRVFGGLRRARDRDADHVRAEGIRSSLAVVPTFDLPNRRYYLLSGAVTAAPAIEAPGGLGKQPPDLWWPDDRAWFVATDTDLTWSCVGGSAALIDEIAVTFPEGARRVDRDSSNRVVG